MRKDASSSEDAAMWASAGGVIDDEDPIWARWALIAIGVAAAAHYVYLALGFAPLHFDEAQYWTYGEALDWGYYSKPPMVAWLIRLSTDVFGDTTFGVRFFAPLLHAWIAWMIFASGRRLFDGRTGFWAAAGYSAMPGVAVSAGLMTTDPAMMAAWATALYALVRALEAEPGAQTAGAENSRAEHAGSQRASSEEAWLWWALVGVGVGLGLLSKYTMIAFALGALGYALFSRQGRWGYRPTDRVGPALAALAALAVFSPNLIWNAQRGFPSFSHVADNAAMSGGPSFDPGSGAEFFFAQAAVIGPVLFAALIWMLCFGDWRREWQYRLLMWLTAPLLLTMIAQAFLSRAHPNWAAPAYVAGVIAVTAWLLDRDSRSLLLASIVIGVVGYLGFGAAGGVYAARHAELPRLYDPYKKMRPDQPICAAALKFLGSAPLVSNDRRLLADCMFQGKLAMNRIRMWSPGAAGSHYQMAAPLRTGEPGAMLLAVHGTPESAAPFLARFQTSEILLVGAVPTHADRTARFVLARVAGFRGYDRNDVARPDPDAADSGAQGGEAPKS